MGLGLVCEGREGGLPYLYLRCLDVVVVVVVVNPVNDVVVALVVEAVVEEVLTVVVRGGMDRFLLPNKSNNPSPILLPPLLLPNLSLPLWVPLWVRLLLNSLFFFFFSTSSSFCCFCSSNHSLRSPSHISFHNGNICSTSFVGMTSNEGPFRQECTADIDSLRMLF